MEKEIKSIGEVTQSSAKIIGVSLKSVKKAMEEYLKNQIDFLETALKYTNKTVLKNRHKKKLIYLKSSLNYMNLNYKLDDYLESVNEFAKTGVK